MQIFSRLKYIRKIFNLFYQDLIQVYMNLRHRDTAKHFFRGIFKHPVPQSVEINPLRAYFI